MIVCVVHFFLTDEYKMAKKHSVTRRRRGQKKSMRKGTRKQQKQQRGGRAAPCRSDRDCNRGYFCQKFRGARNLGNIGVCKQYQDRRPVPRHPRHTDDDEIYEGDE